MLVYVFNNIMVSLCKSHFVNENNMFFFYYENTPTCKYDKKQIIIPSR